MEWPSRCRLGAPKGNNYRAMLVGEEQHHEQRILKNPQWPLLCGNADASVRLSH